MDRRLEWIASKGLFAVMLYFALVDQVGWIRFALVAWIWSMLAISVWAKGPSSRRIASARVPPIGAMTFDLGVLAALFLSHWYWTTFAYAAACGCLALIEARTTSRP